jgi:hypothetical protein
LFDLDDGFRDAAIGKNSADFPKEILKQAIGVRERVWPSGVFFRSMPVITGLRRPLEFRSRRRDAMSVVEAEEPRAIRRVQRERVRQAVRSSLGRVRLISNLIQ